MAVLLTFRAGYGFGSDFSLPVVGLLFSELRQGPPQPQLVAAPDEWMAALCRIPLLHQPGEAWLYNTCSDILGVLIWRRTSLAAMSACSSPFTPCGFRGRTTAARRGPPQQAFDAGAGHDASTPFVGFTLDDQGNPYFAFADNLNANPVTCSAESTAGTVQSDKSLRVQHVRGVVARRRRDVGRGRRIDTGKRGHALQGELCT